MIQTKTHRKYLYTPLRYPGGKTSLFEYFAQIIEANNWKNTVYIEPFAGGAGAALSLLLLNKVDSIVINDFDSSIFAFWDSMLFNTDEFITRIQEVPLTIEEWSKQREIYRNPKMHSRLDLGFAAFYLNRTNRSGILMDAGPIGGKKQEGKWKIDARFNKEALIEKVQLISTYKDKILVSDLDGIEVIKKYSNIPHAFLYIDPPYFVKGADLYLNAFTREHHKNLADTLNKLPSTRWLLSYDNEEEIRLLYRDRKQQPFSLKYSAHHNTKSGSELMVFSDAINHYCLSN